MHSEVTRLASRALPDPELMAIVLRRIELQALEFTRDGTFPSGDADDAACCYRAFFIHRWAALYGRTLVRYGSHDHATLMCANLAMLGELTSEALRMTAKALRWKRN